MKRNCKTKKNRIYSVQFSEELMDKLSHTVKSLIYLSKSHKGIKDNSVCVHLLKEIKDNIDELLENMEEIK